MEPATGMESMYRLLYESSPQAILVTTPTAEIALVNPALCDLLGFDSEELIGRPASEIAVAEDRGLIAVSCDPAKWPVPNRHRTELRLVTKAGDILRVSLACAPLSHPLERYSGVISVIDRPPEAASASEESALRERELR